jgi:hypothetical protein
MLLEVYLGSLGQRLLQDVPPLASDDVDLVAGGRVDVRPAKPRLYRRDQLD